VDGALAWVGGLPAIVLYPMLAVFAALENVFPPLPTDTIVAFGTWIAVRGGNSAMLAFFCSWFGNAVGAAAMYAVGRRHGVAWLHRRFPSLADPSGEARFQTLYARYGVAALVVSRFLPGVRAVVPPFAGALRVPLAGAVTAMAVASAIWYGIISYLAYRAGADWNGLTALLARSGRATGIVAVAIAAIAGAVWLLRRRRARAPS
jgi:membrane protein DedA with SNARE-associated domain